MSSEQAVVKRVIGRKRRKKRVRRKRERLGTLFREQTLVLLEFRDVKILKD